MFFLEVVFGFNFRIPISQDFVEFFNDTFDFISSEFRTDPDNEARDTVHGVISCKVLKLFK